MLRHWDFDPDPYPQGVVAVLAEHFDLDVFDQQVITRRLEAHRARPNANLDIVVDSPAQARWHLQPSADDVSRVILTDCSKHAPEGASPDERVAAANAALARLA